MSQTFYFSQRNLAVKLISPQNILETAIFKQEVKWQSISYFVFFPSKCEYLIGVGGKSLYVLQEDLTVLSGTVGVVFPVDLFFSLVNPKCHKGDVWKK